jgi:hypothetical protein
MQALKVQAPQTQAEQPQPTHNPNNLACRSPPGIWSSCAHSGNAVQRMRRLAKSMPQLERENQRRETAGAGKPIDAHDSTAHRAARAVQAWREETCASVSHPGWVAVVVVVHSL